MKIIKLDEKVECSKLVLNEDLEELTEAGSDTFKQGAAKVRNIFKHGAEKAAGYSDEVARKDAKAFKKGQDIVARDMSPKYRDAVIYLAREDGKYEKPKPIEEFRSLYNSGEVFNDPKVMNAIVAWSNGVLIRRGLEDVAGKGLMLSKNTKDVRAGYKFSWNSDKGIVADDDKDTETSPETAQTAAVQDDADVAKKSTDNMSQDKTTSIDTTSSEVSTEQSSTQETPDPDDNTNASTDVSIANVTDKIMEKFRALDKLTGLQVIDGMGKAVTDTSIITKDSAPTYKVIIDNRKFKLTDFLLSAMKQGFLKEELARVPLFEALLTEAPNLIFNDDELNNPDSIDFKNIIKDRIDTEEAEKAAEAKRIRKAELHNKHANIIDKIETSIGSGKDILKTIEMLHDDLVPPEGEAETVAGEIVRAMMRLLSRSYNDGDKFYSGYGLETCGSSAEYLYDMDSSFSELLQHIVDEAYRIDSNDDLYDDMLKDLTQLVVEYIMENPEFLEEENTEDSRDYHSTDWDLEAEQPRYEFEIMGSADVEQLVEEDIIDAWALNSYVESALEYESWYNNDVEIERPWSHNSTTVTLSNLTKDAVEALSNRFRDDEYIDRFWYDLVSEYKDELDSQDSDDNDDFEEENFDQE